MTDRLAPGMDDVCPWVPEQATRWEAQEIRRHWRNALMHLENAATLVTVEADTLWQRGRHATPDDYVPDYRHEVAGGGLAYYAMQAEAAMVAMAHVRNGALHRIVLAEQAKAREASLLDGGCGYLGGSSV